MVVGRVAVVTGGASGIGLGVSERLAARGDRVAVLDVQGDAARHVAKELEATGGQAVGLAVDVRDRAAVEAALDTVRERFGPIEIAVTSAGVDAGGAFTDITQETWDRVLAINLTGTFHCLQTVVPDMLAAGWGRIVTISSTSAQHGAANRAHYVASKGGVIALTKALAIELAPHGITVNTIPPSIIDTPMAQAGAGTGHVPSVDAIAAMTPVRRAGVPADVAAAVEFLCSEDAGFITGQQIGVNGGWYL
ncbi:SDR family oxidoreductase [Frankia sp. CNm7]|uniref:SDR family oxidoreductase n=1 Tax=Frankia nepalensis TaxID=1836974 RepID=A0A937UMZ4_9ACTN|nr:SDR family NAD(P)-dependent oxidoreductase [Frankia nepalensis]MBL7496367.1 SDR family oxidoreductase [Frankia nepalensis]MBL7508436.1 SDR family oxidoreductase [Frankia nepalensis]MBL7520254.1 SDR family oxidoreductase [Frankia nepalensis]MBL7627568.1 SDR family oxidoreductase [Frankia nepalensis]